MNNGTTIRELSSVGSERLPYKQRVGGSTPSAPTKKDLFRIPEEVFCCVAGVTLTKLVQVQPQVFRIKSKTLC